MRKRLVRLYFFQSLLSARFGVTWSDWVTYLYLKTKGRKRSDILVMLRSVLLIAGTARKNTSCRRGDGWNDRVCSWRERR